MEESKRYILLEKRKGKVVREGTLVNSVYQAFRGDLFQQLEHDLQPSEPHLITVTPMDLKSQKLETERSVLSEISEEIADLLLPVPSVSDRYRIFTMRDFLDRALNLKVDDYVTIKLHISGKEQQGILRYKGGLMFKKGTYFGVQIQVRHKYLITNLS